MGIMDNLKLLDQFILVSGDSDYLSLIKRMHQEGKRLSIISFRQLLAWELRSFVHQNNNCNYWVLESIRVKNIQLAS